MALNYQFCHGYLSKDLINMTRKMIQAFGRVGRKEHKVITPCVLEIML